VRVALVAFTGLLAMASLAIGEPATPERIPDKARKLAERGRELHGKGDYALAIIAFKEAYVLAPSPGLLFNLAQAYRLQGNCDDAALMYRRFIATNPDPDARAIAEAHLATMDRCIAKRGLNLPMDESMAYLKVPPPEDKTLAILESPKAAPPSRRLQKLIGLGIAGAGGIALGTAGVFEYRAYQAQQDVEARYAAGDKWKNIAPIAERGERSASYARAFAIGGGVAAIAGVTVYLLGQRAERNAFVPVSVTPAKRGAEVSLAWQF